MATLTAFAGTEDGFLQSQASTYAAARAGTGTISVFDSLDNSLAVWKTVGADFEIDIGYESFDTSSLDSEANISSVALSIYSRAAVNNADGWTEVRARLFDWGTGLTSADWVATDGDSANDTLLATVQRTAIPDDGYADFTSESAFTSNIDTSGDTRLYYLISEAEAGVAPTGGNQFNTVAAETSGTTQDPKLVVTYSLPGIARIPNLDNVPNMPSVG